MISLYVRNLVIYLIISSLALNLNPGKAYKKQINFFCGLVIVLIAIEPIKYLFNLNEFNLDSVIGKYDQYLEVSKLSYDDENTNRYYGMSLEEGIKDMFTKEKYSVNDVRIILNKYSEVLRCEIVISKEVNSENCEKIKKTINEVYKIEIDNIYILKR